MFNQIQKLACKENRKILLFDVKTTSSVNEPDFGIIDVSTFLFFTDKQREPSLKTMVINPGCIIERKQTRFTGLSNDHTKSAPSWESVGEYISKLAAQNALLVCFNPYSFVAIADQGKRYNYPLKLTASNHLILRSLVEKLDGTKDNFHSYLKSYSIAKTKHPFDRASYRVKETSQLFDAFLDKHGLDVIHEKQELLAKPTLKERRSDLVKKYIDVHGYHNDTLVKIQAIHEDLFPTPIAVSFAITDALVANKLSYDAVANEDQQHHILNVLDDFQEMYHEGKLTPILKEIHKHGHTDVDFIQLHVAMNRAQHNSAPSHRF